jgi:hypothetical protein
MLFMKTPEQGAQTSIYAATSPEAAGKQGAYYADCRERRPAAHCLDDGTARALWEVSERLTACVYGP